jgi:hypothetical protein
MTKKPDDDNLTSSPVNEGDKPCRRLATSRQPSIEICGENDSGFHFHHYHRINRSEGETNTFMIKMRIDSQFSFLSLSSLLSTLSKRLAGSGTI